MNLAQAKTFAKDLTDALNSLLAASSSMKDADFDALQNKKTSLESALLELRKRVSEESSKADLEIANIQASAKEKKAALAVQVGELEMQVANIQTQVRVLRETAERELKEYKSKEIAAKGAELKTLSEAVILQQKVLDDINAQVEAGRRRFA